MIHAVAVMPEANIDSSVDLLRKAQSGDDDALEQLLTRYLPRLRRWASGRLPWGLRSMLDTGDLVQDAVINALPHLNGLEIRTDHALQFYLQRAVKNRIIDLHKRGRRRPVRQELPDEIRAPGTSPVEAAIGAEALERYQRARDSLKEDERQAVVMRVERGLNYGEIAAQLGKKSPDAARMAVTRAIARLADKMGQGSPLDAKGERN
ncbi:MAG: sigma-70 family RNA polymerase sigma factor [Vicinamibacterales bacterium]